jgi:hypothetical protein
MRSRVHPPAMKSTVRECRDGRSAFSTPPLFLRRNRPLFRGLEHQFNFPDNALLRIIGEATSSSPSRPSILEITHRSSSVARLSPAKTSTRAPAVTRIFRNAEILYPPVVKMSLCPHRLTLPLRSNCDNSAGSMVYVSSSFKTSKIPSVNRRGEKTLDINPAARSALTCCVIRSIIHSALAASAIVPK